MTRPALLLAAALTLAASSAFAGDASRPGDLTLSCEALSAEAGKLEAAEIRRARRAESGRRMASFAGAAFSAATPSLMARAGNGTGGLAAQSLMGALQGGALGQSAEPAEPVASPEARRLEHVNTMMTERGC